MAMLLLVNASRNVQFLFFYITWTGLKFASNFAIFNELSKSKVNISLCEHKYPSQQHLPFSTKGYTFVIFFHFQTTFSISCKQNVLLKDFPCSWKKNYKRGICYYYYNFHFVKNQIRTINKKSHIFHFVNTKTSQKFLLF